MTLVRGVDADDHGFDAGITVEVSTQALYVASVLGGQKAGIKKLRSASAVGDFPRNGNAVTPNVMDEGLEHRSTATGIIGMPPMSSRGRIRWRGSTAHGKLGRV
jgi:hypothetical protein